VSSSQLVRETLRDAVPKMPNLPAYDANPLFAGLDDTVSGDAADWLGGG
jgi:hypothetical protein